MQYQELTQRVIPFVNNKSTNLAFLNPEATGLLELAEMHNQLLARQNLIASGTGDDTKKQQPTYVVNRPWIEPPEGSVPFDPQTVIALGIVGTTVTVVTLVVPPGMDGTIQSYSWNFVGGGFNNGSGDLQAQLLRNGVPIRNYENILVEKGTVAQPRTISPLRVYSGQTITLTVKHVANIGLNGNLNASLVGYFYPSQG